ncbi:MAG: paraquat-inducible protein A [Paludibacterium sp.]|uniref:paraquat-inducible protein A n=1 Tax=Paludibacterium sp. TaxID=1917523 RepID=UPI0025CE5841|nr:paraquat-inducible protein A [Paludibacterium sp.]MBV8047948.1 paraquat-inducible protein A [Paludibacterium sp.]MBV8647225.1 paraquat-inducible protein A [Paludibacterium sp.]
MLPRAENSLAGTTLRLLSCPVCGQTTRHDGARTLACPCCGTSLAVRKPDSLSRAWAWLVAATLCYIPANVLPIMETRTLFGRQDNTILSGVVYLWLDGSWPLALVVFIASILVPLLKILCLSFLMLSVHFRWRWAPLQRTRLYRLLEAVGPWSMLDIYVVALLVALVQWQSLAMIQAGPGALAFAAVVVLTMLSAHAFDPRLIWDAAEEDRA